MEFKEFLTLQIFIVFIFSGIDIARNGIRLRRDEGGIAIPALSFIPLIVGVYLTIKML